MSTLIADGDASDNVQFSSIPSQTDIRKEVRAPAQDKSQEQEAAAAAPATEKPARPDWLPEKFESPEAMAVSYSSLENELGRQADEIGSLRKLTNDLATSRQTPTPDQSESQQVPDLTADDVLNDPRKAISQVVREEVQRSIAPVTETVSNLEASLTLRDFSQRHPSFETVQHSPEFAAWLQEDPLRNSLAQRALADANSGDLSTMDDLFTNYEASAGASHQNEQTQEEKAAEESAQAIASSGGQGAEVPKEYIRRSDLDAIMLSDRDRYDSEEFQAWMRGKYAKGLVK